MSQSVNKVILIGHLGADPEIRSFETGRSATFSLATSERWKNKTTGEMRERTDWHRVVIFNETLVKLAEQFLKKGSKVYIEGQQKTRDYIDKKSGAKTYVTETVLTNFDAQMILLDAKHSSPPSATPDDYGPTD